MRDGDEWVLTVSDHGVGIRPDQLSHVFDRFRQTESTRVRPEGGRTRLPFDSEGTA